MEPRTLSQCARLAGGRVAAGDPDSWISRVVTDSREARPGDLFVALRGERFDGHHFIQDAVAKGAIPLVAEGAECPTGCARIEADDTRAAYSRLAGGYRRQFSPTVIGVAGSNGKTSVKEMIAAMLGASRRTVKSAASHNNDIGVPASLLLIDGATEAAVFEAGTNHPGELAPLARLISPRIGVLTNIGREHLEFFGDIAGVAAEEGALAAALPPADLGGVLILPEECALASAVTSRTDARIVRAGWSGRADWRGRIVACDWSGVAFDVVSPDDAWSGAWRLPIPARHMALNALLALAAAAAAGAEPGPAREALAAFCGARRRLEVSVAAGVRVVDDTYNANADSLLAALQTIAQLPCSGRRVAVIGDLAELGAQTDEAHREAGRTAARLGIDAVWCVGQRAEVTAAAAGVGRSRVCDPSPTLAFHLAEWLQPGDAVLLKASRAHRLDLLVEALLAELLKKRTPESVAA